MPYGIIARFESVRPTHTNNVLKLYCLLLFQTLFLAINAQPLLHQHFQFSITDEVEDGRLVLFPNGADKLYLVNCSTLIIEKDEIRYRLSSLSNTSLFGLRNGFALAYPGNTSCELIIKKEFGDSLQTMRIVLHELEERDFAKIRFTPGNHSHDLAFGKGVEAYKLQVPELPQMGRDISTVLSSSEKPSYIKLPFEDQQRKKQHATWSLKKYTLMQSRFDSLKESQFPNGLFDQYFSTQCAHYSRQNPYTSITGYFQGDTTHLFDNVRFFYKAWGDRRSQHFSALIYPKTHTTFQPSLGSLVFTKKDLEFIPLASIPSVVAAAIPTKELVRFEDGSLAINLQFALTRPPAVINRRFHELPVAKTTTTEKEQWVPKFVFSVSKRRKTNRGVPEDQYSYFFEATTGKYIGAQRYIPRPIWDE